MKQKISISIDEDTLKQLEKVLAIQNKKFRNKSHAIEYCLNKSLIEELKNE